MGISLISNPPYNLKWKVPDLVGFLPQYAGYASPPESNANMAFVLSALNLIEDRAVLLLPNSVISSSQKNELMIRKQLICENLLLAVITLPSNMFESTNIPTCLLIFDKHKDTRKIAMMDLKEHCKEEVRDQRGQFGGNAHTGRTYHKRVNVISDDVMDKCVGYLKSKQDEPNLCKWIMPEEISESDYNLTPRRYLEAVTEEKHRPFDDIANDYNRIIQQKNAIKIRMNRTVAKRLGYDCMNVDRPDLSASFGVVGQKTLKENNISFGADDGITIKISTKDTIHPLILDFLNHWKQMIMYLNNEENRVLAEFRDALLPDLMSGRIDVRKAESENKDESMAACVVLACVRKTDNDSKDNKDNN